MTAKKLFNILLAVNAIALLILFSLSFFKEKTPAPVVPVNIDPKEIIVTKLAEYGIENIEFKTVRDTPTVHIDSLMSDFPVHYLVYEIQKEIQPGDLYLTGSETEINTKTEFIISGDGTPCKLKFSFIQSEKGNAKELVLFVKKNPQINDNFVNTIKTLPYPVTVILTPSEKERVFSQSLIDNRIRYGVLITPSIEEELYKISESFSPLRIQQTANRLANDFETSDNFLIEAGAARYRSSTYESVRRRIIAANKPVFLADTIVSLISYEDTEISSRLLKLASSLKPGKQEIILFPFESLGVVTGLVPQLSKKSIRIANLR